MKAITLFGRMLSFSRLKIQSDDLTAIKQELSDLTKNNSVVPAIIDSEVHLDLNALVEVMWELGVQPIGVVEGVLTEQANALRLATFPSDGKRIERIKANAISETDQDTPKSDEALQNTQVQEVEQGGISSVVHNQMLRSGQSLQHLGGDLIVIGGVNKGAEAITDNSLHVYGHGYGRLVAGATGDKNARIFCQKFYPTLVSVAGTYCLSEAIPPDVLDKAVQVHYDETEGLVFTVMAV